MKFALIIVVGIFMQIAEFYFSIFNMKKLYFLLFVTLFACVNLIAQSPPPAASTLIEAAVSKASAENKNIVLMFHASWCGWCKKMDASLNDPSCKSLFDKYYVIEHLTVLESKEKVELENPGGMDYLKKFSGEKEGLPYWVILDKKGEFLFDSRMRDDAGKLGNTGCPASEKEVNFFVDLLKKTSGLTKEQLEIIAKRFRTNEAH